MKGILESSSAKVIVTIASCMFLRPSHSHVNSKVKQQLLPEMHHIYVYIGLLDLENRLGGQVLAEWSSAVRWPETTSIGAFTQWVHYSAFRMDLIVCSFCLADSNALELKVKMAEDFWLSDARAVLNSGPMVVRWEEWAC